MRRQSRISRTRRQEIARQARQFFALAVTRGMTADQIQGELLTRFSGELAPGEARMYAMGWTTPIVRDGLAALVEEESGEEDAASLELIDVARWLRGEVRPAAWLTRLCRLFRCHQAQLGWPPQGNELPVDYTPPGAGPRALGRESLSASGVAIPYLDDPAPRADAFDREFVMLVMRRREFLEALALNAGVSLVDIAAGGPAAILQPFLSAERLSIQERRELQMVLGRNIEASWAVFHTSDAPRVETIAQLQLHVLKAHRSDLEYHALPGLFSGAYRLLGATQHRQGRYQEALRAHDSAYLAALEGADVWNMAESRLWLAYGMRALGQHGEARSALESALRLVSQDENVATIRLRARLLASGAENAGASGAAAEADRLLDACAELAAGLSTPDEEFDRGAWCETAAACAMHQGQAERAIPLFTESLRAVPPHWLARRMFATIGLVGALASICEREAMLSTLRSAFPLLEAMQAQELTRHMIASLRRMRPRLPHDSEFQELVVEAERHAATIG